MSNAQLAWLIILRIVIGWHFLYEGYVKLMNPGWSSIGYLKDSKGPFSEFFYFFASHPTILKVIDLLNEWGLSLIGLCLILGLSSRIAALGGMVLLSMYYLSHPPYTGLDYTVPSEGNYLLINKTLIEFCAMGVLSLFQTSRSIGMDRLLQRKNNC